MPADQASQEKSQEEQVPKRVPEKDLHVWKAPARPFKTRDREFRITIIAMAAISGLILFFVEGFMTVILIISIIFLFYILSTVKPDEIDYKLTNKGVYIADKKTDYLDIQRFSFGKRFEKDLLILDTLNLTGRLELVIKKGDEEKIRKTLKDYIPEEESPSTNVDKITDWVGNKVPGLK